MRVEDLLPGGVAAGRKCRAVSDVVAAYSRRSAEYSELLGSMAAMHASEVHLIISWAKQCDGIVLDVGCGPGHWTGYLAAEGIDARGIDKAGAGRRR